MQILSPTPDEEQEEILEFTACCAAGEGSQPQAQFIYHCPLP